ncbi:hypothetical protein D9M68_19420 [compost metagenome]
MRPSLESILQGSLADLRDLSNQAAETTAQIGPIEGLTVITADQISAEVLEHVAEERYGDEEVCRNVCEDYIVKNEEEHATMRRDLAEISGTIQNISAAMEMAGTITSMESLDDGDVAMANVAFNNIAQQAGDCTPPVLIAEDGQLTTASMEGLGDFLRTLLTRLKKWIKEKFQNMTIAMRRGIHSRAVYDKRLAAIAARISNLPSDYGIPAKNMRLDGRYVGQVYFDGKAMEITGPSVKARGQEVLSILKKAITEIHPDSVKRSDALADSIANILTMRDEVSASDALHKLFKDVTGPLPAAKIANGLKETAGLAFFDAASGYRSRYRDVEWIMELVVLIEAPATASKPRLNGMCDTNYADVAVLSEVVNELSDILGDSAASDYDYYNELCHAWHEASEVYERLWDMVTNVQFNHMSNELWRGFDVGVTAMFNFLDKAYYSIEHLRAPYFRLVDGVLYNLEEQMKGYAAVNR